MAGSPDHAATICNSLLLGGHDFQRFTWSAPGPKSEWRAQGATDGQSLIIIISTICYIYVCPPVASLCKALTESVQRSRGDGINVEIGRPCQPREGSPDCPARKGRLAVLIDDTIGEESTNRNFHRYFLQLLPGRSIPPHRYGILVECTNTHPCK